MCFIIIIFFPMVFIVIPERPTYLAVLNKTLTSATIRWSVGDMEDFPPGLEHKIIYKSLLNTDRDVWHVSVEFSRKLKKKPFRKYFGFYRLSM